MKKTVALDFDGVIHAYSKGWYDGSIYDPPIKDTDKALKILASKYRLVIYSCRARTKQGIKDVWEWLKKYDFAQYISEVTAIKPVAIAQIDDTAITFTSWLDAMTKLKNM